MFPSVDRVGSKFVFNIAHNRHRLVAGIDIRSPIDYSTIMIEPLDRDAARRLIRNILAVGAVRFSKHSLDEMARTA